MKYRHDLVIEKCTNLKSLLLGSRLLVGLDVKKLPKLRKLIIIESPKHKLPNLRITSNTIEIISMDADIRSLEIDCPNLIQINIPEREIKQLTIRSNKLQTIKGDSTISKLSVLACPIPNHTAENVSPLHHGWFLSYVSNISHFECPYLSRVSVKSMETLSDLVAINQTPLLSIIDIEETIIDSPSLLAAVKTFPITRLVFFGCSMSDENQQDPAVSFENIKLKDIIIRECDSNVSKFICQSFRDQPGIERLCVNDCLLDSDFIESLSTPKHNDWKDLLQLELDLCVNLIGEYVADLYSNITHFEHLKQFSLVADAESDCESLYAARIPQYLESFNGAFNTLEIVPSTSCPDPRMSYLKTLIIQPNPSSKYFNINTMFDSLEELFVSNFNEQPLYESSLEVFLTDDGLVSEIDGPPPSMDLVSDVIRHMPKLKYVSQVFFSDEPTDLKAERPELHFFSEAL